MTLLADYKRYAYCSADPECWQQLEHTLVQYRILMPEPTP